MRNFRIAVRAAVASRAVFLIVLVAVAALAAVGSVSAEPATQVITAVPIGPNGEPIDGYREAPSQSNITDVADCTTSSPAAVADDIYYCSPSAADADVCWPSTPGSLLCVNDPWNKELHRVSYSDPLPHVKPLAAPQPFALLLDNGTRCRLRNGGAWGGREDGYAGAYGCGPADSNLAVLVMPNRGAASAIDRSMPVWTVKVGELGSPAAVLPPPQTHTVTTAWFAGDFVPV
jgi:hypothetical protein